MKLLGAWPGVGVAHWNKNEKMCTLVAHYYLCMQTFFTSDFRSLFKVQTRHRVHEKMTMPLLQAI